MWYYITNSYVTSKLFFNGLEALMQNSSVLPTGANSASQNVTIPVVNNLDISYLDASLMIYSYYYLYTGSLFYCPYDYYYFVFGALGISYIQLDSSSIRFANASM